MISKASINEDDSGYVSDRFKGPRVEEQLDDGLSVLTDTALVRDAARTYRVDGHLECLAAIASAIFKLAHVVDDLETSIRRAAK